MDLRVRLFSVSQHYGLEGYANFPPCNKTLWVSACFSLQYSPWQEKCYQFQINLFLPPHPLLDAYSVRWIKFSVVSGYSYCSPVSCSTSVMNYGSSRVQEEPGKTVFKKFYTTLIKSQAVSWICQCKINYVSNIANSMCSLWKFPFCMFLLCGIYFYLCTEKM